MKVLNRPKGRIGVTHPWKTAMSYADGRCEVQHPQRGMMVRCPRRADDVLEGDRERLAVCTICRHQLGAFTAEEKRAGVSDFQARQTPLFND